MTIEDWIRDEKLQYDINREAAKIYLTGKEILSYTQQQIIKQANLTYSPLVKAFEKQTKTIKEQREKQIKAIQDKRPIKSIEKFTNDINDSPIVLKEKEIYINLQKTGWKR